MLGDFDANGKLDMLTQTWNADFMENSINNVTIKESSILKNKLFFDPWPGDPTRLFANCYAGDYDNDGLTDILVQANDHRKVHTKWGWYILKNSGAFFSDMEKIDLNLNRANTDNEDEGRYAAYPIDYNGDGYVDIILGDETHKNNKYSYTNWFFYKNTGGAFSSDYYIKTTAPLSKLNAVVMDTNGDGVQDLVFGDARGYRYNRYFHAFTMFGANKRNVVRAITDGMGAKEEFTYTYFSDYNQETRDAADPVKNLKNPIMLVDTYTDALGSKTTYAYSNPKVHTEGKGFLGFETVTATNDATASKTVSTYEYDNAYYHVSLKRRETTATDGRLIAWVEMTNQIRTIVGNKRYLPLATGQVAVDYLKGITQTTDNVYNDDGTLQSQKVTTGSATVSTVYDDYKTRVNNGLVSYLPQTISVIRKRDGDSDTTRTRLTYVERTGQIHTKTENEGLYGETTTTYDYHFRGNVKTVFVRPKGLLSTITTYHYAGDGYYIFPTRIESKKNDVALSDVSYTYDYSACNVKTKTDNILRQTVTSEYNSFGRKTKETQPNGAETAYSVLWDNSRANAAYKTVVRELSVNRFSLTYFDKYGREVYTETSGWKGKLLTSSKTYNPATGLLEKATRPRYVDEPEQYTTYAYNDLARRLTEETFFDGVNSLKTTYSYGYNNRTTSVETPDGQTRTTVTDAGGLVSTITDAGGTISYTDFTADGQPRTISYGGANTTIGYDEMGRKVKLTDPNAGTITYSYTADGQLKRQVSAKGDSTVMAYDYAGRIITKTVTNTRGGTPATDVTTYAYVPDDEAGAGQIKSIEQKYDGATNHKQVFTYNSHHQIATASDTYEGVTYTTAYGYDHLWRPATTTTPSGLAVTDMYDSYGDVYQVKAGDKVVWEGKDQNSSGQWLKYNLGNGLQTRKTYSDRQELETIQTGIENNGAFAPGVQNLKYGYQPTTGNLLTRKDILNNRDEDFKYDELDRLETAQLTGAAAYSQTMTYLPNGNIDTKSDVGTYQYNTPRPNAMSGITGVQAGVSADKQFIDYTTFNKISEIRQGTDENSITKKYEIYYGLDNQRIKTVYTEENGMLKTRYYFGAYERTIQNNVIQETDYISTPAGITAMRGYNDVEDLEKIYYLHTDNLGSVQAITNESKAVVSSYYYTPWGGRVLLGGADITDRGYTFHEHLTEFGLIDMNGRVYDPVLARFLSPDPYVQAPDYTQNFNRYSYCYNNPFKFTDPSGELQIGPFYVSLNVGWGYGSGFSFGISAGVGIEKIASAGIYVGYNTSGSFTFSANAGIAGFYVSGGYDTKGGWNASAGWSAPIPPLGIVSFNSNMLGISAGYSQSGGWSGNYMGVQITKNGASFSPSVGVGINAFTHYSNDNIDMNNELCYMSESRFKNKQEMMDYLESINRNASDIDADQIRYADNYPGNKKLGSTRTTVIFGKISHIEMVMFPHKTLDGFNITFNHETIHVYHYRKYGEMDNTNGDYSETVAYRHDNLYDSNTKLPKDIVPYTGNLSLFDVPWPKLIPIYMNQKQYYPNIIYPKRMNLK
ncbi:MAG: RHS repeat-associated core domain-containing protein [Paludibacteraceae bacterium]